VPFGIVGCGVVVRAAVCLAAFATQTRQRIPDTRHSNEPPNIPKIDRVTSIPAAKQAVNLFRPVKFDDAALSFTWSNK